MALFRSLLLGCCALSADANADTLLPPDQSEEIALRAELERVAREPSDNAEAARKSLEALNEPATSAHGRQTRNRRERGARRIVNGIQTVRHSAVAALLKGDAPGSAGLVCTGTLVGCNKVLTAAHCINKDPDPKKYFVFFQLLGFVKVKRIDWQPNAYKESYADIAMLTLEKSVEGIAPIGINTSATPINGAVATIVGFGRSGGNRFDYGIKREGSVKFSKCTGAYTDKRLLCWDFDADVKLKAGDSNTCNADSGGGIFMPDKVNNRIVQRVVGVVAGGRDENCVKNDHSYNTDVFAWRDWLEKVGEGQFSDKVCGASEPVDTAANVRTAVVTLDASKTETTFEIEVPESTRSLGVAMNGEDDGTWRNDFDLVVYRDTHRLEALCTRSERGQFAFCELKPLPSARLAITVRRKIGSGIAQLAIRMRNQPHR